MRARRGAVRLVGRDVRAAIRTGRAGLALDLDGRRAGQWIR